jgi:TM2 domain-containing membrane protein YozV
MNQPVKAALLSGLVVPGAGQIYLKRYFRGIVFLLPSVACCFALAWAVVQIAAAMINAAPFQKGALRLNDVISVATSAVGAMNLSSLSMILALLAVCWIVSILDAYFLGIKLSPEITTVSDRQSPSDPL